MKVFTTLWNEPVEIDEVEVYYSRDGLGRLSIARRLDGFFHIYTHWHLPESSVLSPPGAEPYVAHWQDVKTPLEELYRDVEPEDGIFGAIEDARKDVLARLARSELPRL